MIKQKLNIPELLIQSFIWLSTDGSRRTCRSTLEHEKSSREHGTGWRVTWNDLWAMDWSHDSSWTDDFSRQQASHRQ